MNTLRPSLYALLTFSPRQPLSSSTLFSLCGHFGIALGLGKFFFGLYLGFLTFRTPFTSTLAGGEVRVVVVAATGVWAKAAPAHMVATNAAVI